jgi:hypothetical protein
MLGCLQDSCKVACPASKAVTAWNSGVLVSGACIRRILCECMNCMGRALHALASGMLHL